MVLGDGIRRNVAKISAEERSILKDARFEDLLREINPDLSLHYWDWTTDRRKSPDGKDGTVSLFTAEFMGNSIGDIGKPFADFKTTEDEGTDML